MTQVQERLQYIPAWRDATIEPLAGGLTNEAFQLSIDDRRAVLKVDACPRSRPFNTRLEEAVIQRCAADAGLAARVIAAEEQLYLCEYIDGQVWSQADIIQNENLDLLGERLRDLHALPLTGRRFDVASAASQYAKLATSLSANVTAMCLDRIQTLGKPRDLRCCHNDLVAANIIASPEIQFLDWEYACDNSPLFDLATVIEHHDLDARQSARFLRVYSGDGNPVDDAALDDYRAAYLALLCLWIAAQEEHDADYLRRVASKLSTTYS